MAEDYTDTSVETLAKRAEQIVSNMATAPVVAPMPPISAHQEDESFFGATPDYTDNTIILGDCIEQLKDIPKKSVDLIYLDPPFNSNKNYIVVDEGDTGDAQVNHFKDTWKGGTQTYLDFLYDRVLLMKELLKDTGSFYLHCDPTESHYIKVNVLDKIFGRNNFRNEIVWCYMQGGRPKSSFANKHDVIFFYTKSNKWNFNADEVKIPYEITSPKTSGSVFTLTDKDGRKYYNKKVGNKTYVYYEDRGKTPYDWWTDIYQMTGRASVSDKAEAVGYPTQKPLALLERIIKASSNPGDIVLDPFMGSGTTGVAAVKLGRKFIGIDQSPSAIATARHRLLEVTPVISVLTHQFSYDYIRNMAPFVFEKRIVEWMGGVPNSKQVGDGGIDGRIMSSKTGISVKRQDKAGRNVIDNLKSALQREKLLKGIVVSFDFTKDAYAEVSRLKAANEADITLTKVKDIVPINEPPTIKLSLDGKVIKADANDPDGEIVNYAWSVDNEIVKLVDMSAELEIDKEWKKGKHTIACKATDSGAASTKTFYSLENNVLTPLYRDEKQ